jgi:hypothetical protein
MAQDPYLDALFANQANPPQLPPAPPQPGGPYQAAGTPNMPPPPMPNANPMGMAPGNQLGGLMPPQAQGGQQSGLPMPLLLQLLNLIGSKANPRGQQIDQYTPISNIGIRG